MPIIFGPNSKADFKEIYMDAKRNGEIKARIRSYSRVLSARLFAFMMRGDTLTVIRLRRTSEVFHFDNTIISDGFAKVKISLCELCQFPTLNRLNIFHIRLKKRYVIRQKISTRAYLLISLAVKTI